MNIQERTGAQAPSIVLVAIAVVITSAALLLTPGQAFAGSGGLGTDPPSGNDSANCRGKARLLSSGKAVAPACAPRRVQRAIRAANKISNTKYVWGGGHGSFESKGYDCSGAVSYMLHGAGVLDTPLDSGSLARWGNKRKGDWITIYANSGHVYAVVAGLRWDTSGGPGPRWHTDGRSSAGFTVRHPKGL